MPKLARPTTKKKIGARKRWSKLQTTATLGAIALIFISAQQNWGLGSFSIFGAGPFQIACPLGVAQIIAASLTIVPTLALAGLVGVIVTIVLGRAFCGWLCPGRWLFNRAPRMAKTGWKNRAWVQAGIVLSVIGAAAITHNPVFCIICPVGAICRGAIAAGTGGSVLPSIGWLSALVSVEWLSGRSWCRDLCPVGATLSRISALNPFIKPQAQPAKCRPCLACMKKCPENVNLSQQPDLSTCTKCFACQGACPRNAVQVQLASIKSKSIQ